MLYAIWTTWPRNQTSGQGCLLTGCSVHQTLPQRAIYTVRHIVGPFFLPLLKSQVCWCITHSKIHPFEMYTQFCEFWQTHTLLQPPISIQKFPSLQKSSLVPVFSPNTQPLETTDVIYVPLVLSLPECHIMGLYSMHSVFGSWHLT